MCMRTTRVFSKLAERMKAKTGTSSEKYFYWIFFGFSAFHLFLMATMRLYPFVDMPNHLAMATIFKYYDDPQYLFSQYYTINAFLRPNTFHLWFCSLDIFPSVEFGNTIFLCLYVILFPLSVLCVIKKIEGNLWYALLSFVFMYNYSFSYGFVGSIISIPLVLFIFCSTLNFFQKCTLPSSFSLMLLFVLLFFMHALATLFALLILGVCCLVYRKKMSPAGFVSVFVIIAPVLLLVLQWWLSDSASYEGDGLLDSVLAYYKNDFLPGYKLRLGLFLYDNYALFKGAAGYLTGLFFTSSTIIIILCSYCTRKDRKRPFKTHRCFVPVAAFFLCALACFLCIPLGFSGYNYVFERFPVYVFVTFILCGSLAASEKIGNVLKYTIVIVVLLHSGLWYGYFREFNAVNQDFTKAFTDVPEKNKIVGGLLYDFKYRGKPVYRHFLDYYIVWHRGIALTRFIDDRSLPVQRKADKTLLPRYYENMAAHGRYDGRYQNMHYLFVRGDVPDKDEKYMQDYRVLRSIAHWKAYQKDTLL